MMNNLDSSNFFHSNIYQILEGYTMLVKEIEEKYKLFKQMQGDNLLIKIGIVGVLVGLLFSITIINQFFAWILLLGAGLKLFAYVVDAQKRFETADQKENSFFDEVEEKYKKFKENKGDNLLIQVGVVGVVIGLLFSISFINQFFAWILLVGVGIKLYDYVIDAKKKITVKKEL